MSLNAFQPLNFTAYEDICSSVKPNVRVDASRCAKSEAVDEFLNTKDAYLALRIWLELDGEQAPLRWDVETLRPILLRAIRDIDDKINDQTNAILHHPRFQQLEASWRGVHYLCGQAGDTQKVGGSKVKILNLSWQDLSRDSAKAIEFDQSELFKLVYTNEFNMPGGQPFGMLVGDYQVRHTARHGVNINDLSVIKSVAHCAAAAFSPFITGASPELFGVNHFSELASVSDIKAQFEQPDYVQWRNLRDEEDARFIGITVPNLLMREPHRRDGSRREGFWFEEQITDTNRDYLWGNGAYGVAAVALRAFNQTGWFSQIRGLKKGSQQHGLIVDLPCDSFKHSRNSYSYKPSVNLQVADRLEFQLADNGFITLSTVPHTPYLVLYSNATVNRPPSFDSKSASVNARLSSMLQYMLCVSRIAHYIKLLGRDKVGSYETANSIQGELQRWLNQYTTASDEASEAIRAKYPLNEAKIQVKDKPGKSGHFYSVIHLRPHFQLDQMVSTIRLVTELSPRNF